MVCARQWCVVAPAIILSFLSLHYLWRGLLVTRIIDSRDSNRLLFIVIPRVGEFKQD